MSDNSVMTGLEIFTIKMIMVWLIKKGSYLKQALEIRRRLMRNPSVFFKKMMTGK
jgi:hypothetical protein